MRFELFLENAEIFTNNQKEIKKFKTLCAPIIKRYQDVPHMGPMYRGYKKNLYDYIKTRRKNRRPMDSKPIFQKMFDKYFFKKFGWKPRSEGVFVSGDYDNAE